MQKAFIYEIDIIFQEYRSVNYTFYQDGEVDFVSLKKLVDYHVDAGTMLSLP